MMSIDTDTQIQKNVEELEQQDNEVMVTVVCVTYNHEKYIGEALESFVRQKTNFRFQVYVGEDCSPDNTRAIVREYAEKYPDIIVPFYRDPNVGAIRNFGDLCERVTTKYIAFCDGDDYWIDDNKLQMQFDFMESHPELNGCFSNAKVQIDDTWGGASVYKKNKDGELIWPDCIPDFKMPKDNRIDAKVLINVNCVHTSTAFVRINPEVVLPDDYYLSVIGEIPLFLMHMGKGQFGFIPKVLSVYRRNDTGVVMYKDMEENFLKTRPYYIRYLSYTREYFIKHYDGYAQIEFENRIKLETANYLGVLVRRGDTDLLSQFCTEFPDAACISLNAYLSFYWDSRRMTTRYGWEGNKAVARDPIFMRAITPLVKSFVWLKKSKNRIKNWMHSNCVFRFFKNALSFSCYWLNSLIPKKRNLWVFTSFFQRTYMDNAKYYYEYVLEHHPEIEAVWLTRNRMLYKKLKNEGKKVYKTRTFKAWWKLVRAKVAVTDHFRMSDYTCLAGFNHGTKVLQLWHGVGFKSMGDGTQVKNTDVRGVRYSYDLIPQPGDSLLKRIRKHIKYFFCACNREMFEDYFMFVCPGQERIDMIGKMWNIPENRYFMAGHPRNLPLYEHEVSADEPKILYAPTYRMDAGEERIMIDLCLNSVVEIQEAMEQIGGSFVIRLHPHTWRNYQTEILNRIRPYDRISLDTKKDVYQSLGQYSIVISDYSSISLDFAMLDRPVIYFCFDYDRFIKNDAGFNLDFKSCTPGPIVYTWEETLQKVKEYTADPSKDRDWCRERCRYFFDQSVNNAQNSERITEELKRRLHIS